MSGGFWSGIDRAGGKQRFDLGGRPESPAIVGVIERFDSERITSDRDARLVIKNGRYAAHCKSGSGVRTRATASHSLIPVAATASPHTFFPNTAPPTVPLFVPCSPLQKSCRPWSFAKLFAKPL